MNISNKHKNKIANKEKYKKAVLAAIYANAGNKKQMTKKI